METIRRIVEIAFAVIMLSVTLLVLLSQAKYSELKKEHCSAEAHKGPVLYSVYTENGVDYLRRTRNQAYYSCDEKLKKLYSL